MRSPSDLGTDQSASRVAVWLLRHRALVFGIALLVALAGGGRTARTYAALRSDLEELLPESAPSVVALQELRARMPGLRHLGIVVDTGGPENLAAANLFADALAERIARYPGELAGAVRTGVSRERRFVEKHVLQFVEPSDVKQLRDAVEKRRDWQVTQAMDMDLLDEAPPPPIPIETLRKKYEERYGTHPQPHDRFVSGDGRTVVVLVQASSHATGQGADRELLDRIRKDVADLGFPSAYNPSLRLGYAGDVATRVEEMDGLVVDLGVSGVLVLLLVIGVIVAFFRSWRAVPILGIPLAVGTVATFGVAALPPLSIEHLNSNTAFLGSIVVGNGINGGIILLARYREERRQSPVALAIATALSSTWRPTLAAAAAAAMAYGSLVFTDFRGFNQFGWIGAIGMLVCWASNMVLIPVLVATFGRTLSGPENGPRITLGQRLVAGVTRYPRTVLGAVALMLVASGFGIWLRAGEWVEYDLSKLRRRDSWVSGERYWGPRMDATLGRYLTPTVVMAADAEHARSIRASVLSLRDSGQAGGLIASVRTADDVLPPGRERALGEAMRLRDVLTPRLKGELSRDDRALVERALSDEALVPLDVGSLPEGLTAGLRERDGRIDRTVLVFPKLDAGTWDATRMKAFSRDVRAAAAADGRPARVAGSLPLSSDIAGALESDAPRASVIALLAVVFVCAAAFCSAPLSLAAVSSLLAGVLLMLGLLAGAGARLNFSNFVALPITFGVAADYSINILKRYQLERRAGIGRTLGATGGAVALCSLTTIIGFGSLLLAQNRALFSFGVFAVSGEITCLAIALVALPALLGWSRAPRRARPAGASSPSERAGR